MPMPLLGSPPYALNTLMDYVRFMEFHATHMSTHLLGAVMVFSVLFMMLLFMLEGIGEVYPGAALREKRWRFPALVAATAALWHSPAGDAVDFWIRWTVRVVWQATAGFDWRGPVVALWAAGVALCLCLLAARCLRLRRRLAALPEYPDAGAVAKARAVAGVRRPVSVKAGGKGCQVGSWGVLRAWIVVPDDFAERFTEAERHWIYLHELTHFQRRDPLRYVGMTLWKAFLWFDPVCRRAVGDIRHGFELACDRAVVTLYGADPVEYSRLIVKAAALERGMPIGFSSGSGNIRRRIGLLLGERAARKVRRPLRGAFVAVLMASALVWCCATADEIPATLSKTVKVVGADGVVREIMYSPGGTCWILLGGDPSFTEELQEMGRRDPLEPDAGRTVFL
jgi:Zn-dependent protease with chaperone function